MRPFIALFELISDYHQFGAPTSANDKKMISNEGKMEKSMLNFKAANVDWNPTDPSGSLYLSRMASLANVGGGSGSTTLPFDQRDSHSIVHLYRRRHFKDRPYQVSHPSRDHVQFMTLPSDLSTSVQVHGDDVSGGKTLVEKAQEYDWALKQSQNVAGARRGGMAEGGGAIGGSMLLGGYSVNAPAASVYTAQRAHDLAKTVVLEDLDAPPPLPQRASGTEKESEGGEGSELIGESELGGSDYVDGARRERMGYGDGQDGGIDIDGEEFLEEDGGVLGLLAQIYGRRGI